MNILQKFYTRKSSDKYPVKKILPLYIVLFIILILSFFAAIIFGSSNLKASAALKAIFGTDKESTVYKIIFYIRLPRAVAAILSGAALAVSGVIIQAVLNNAMASPNIIGVNAGAGLFAVIAIAISPAAIHFIPVAAFSGALLASILIYAIAKRTGASRMTITLVGITVSSILTAGINTVKTVFPNSIYNMTMFSVGGLSCVDFSVLKYAGPAIIIAVIIAIAVSKDIDILSLGEETALGLGMNVGFMRFFLLILSSVLAGCAVSFAGLLGFVGLIIPHIVRRIVGNRHIILVPICALCGGEFVLICDFLGRFIFKPYELPAGIILSFIGGFFFIGMILVQRKSKLYD